MNRIWRKTLLEWYVFIYNVEFHIESKITYIRTQSSREKQNTNVYGFRNNIVSVIPSIFNVISNFFYPSMLSQMLFRFQLTLKYIYQM